MDNGTKNSITNPIATQNIFHEIIKNIKKIFTDKTTYNISFANYNDKNEMIIRIRLKRNSKVNTLSSDILFDIIIDYLFPETTPFVKCFSNFIFPTLFDGKNLLFSILNHNWMKDTTIVDIIKALPIFISRVIENFGHKLLIYYGDYEMDKIYDMNEFLINRQLNYFKVKQKLIKDKRIFSKKRYILLTDTFFLLFDPNLDNLNFGRLIFWGDIRQIKTCSVSEISSEYLYLEWKDEEDKISIIFEFDFLNSNITDFINKYSKKIIILKEKFNLFHKDMSKPSNDDNQLSPDKLIELIKYKEELFEKKYTVNLMKELINLYQKIIEIFSAKNDQSFSIYLDKLHKILQNNEFHIQSGEKYNSLDNNADESVQTNEKYKYSIGISENPISNINA